MQDLILDDAGRINFVSSKNAVVDKAPFSVVQSGREYTQFSYIMPINATTRIIKLVSALAITVFTALIALFSKYVRDLWSKAVSGKEPLVILSPAVPRPDFVAKMHVLSTLTGYIGKKEDAQLAWPEYWDKMTLENGDPFPLDPTDFVIRIGIKDEQNAFPSDLPDDIFLPFKLLETVNANDKIRIKYDGKLMELEAHQHYHTNPNSCGNFEEFIEGVSEQFLNSDRAGIDFTSLFQSGTNPLFFNTLGTGGTIFTLSQNGINLSKKAVQELREVEDETNVSIKDCLSAQWTGDKNVIQAEVPGASIEDIDILINQKFIVIYSKNIIGESLSKMWWDLSPELEDETLSSLTEKLLNAEYVLNAGILQIYIS